MKGTPVDYSQEGERESLDLNYGLPSYLVVPTDTSSNSPVNRVEGRQRTRETRQRTILRVRSGTSEGSLGSSPTTWTGNKKSSRGQLSQERFVTWSSRRSTSGLSGSSMSFGSYTCCRTSDLTYFIPGTERERGISRGEQGT